MSVGTLIFYRFKNVYDDVFGPADRASRGCTGRVFESTVDFQCYSVLRYSTVIYENRWYKYTVPPSRLYAEYVL